MLIIGRSLQRTARCRYFPVALKARSKAPQFQLEYTGISTNTVRQLLSPFGNKPDATALLTILVLILVVGLGSTLRYQAFSESQSPAFPNGDAAKYLLYGYNLKNFGIYSKSEMVLLSADTTAASAREILEPDALVTPGYPVFVSRFLGGEFTVHQRDRILLAQVALSSLTILLAYLAFAPIGRTIALGVAALTALSPHLVNMNLFMLTEPLFCFLLIAFAWLLSNVTTSAKWPLFLLTGLVFAMATLTRPWIQGYLLVVIPFMVFSAPRIPVRNAVLIFLGAAMLLTPWFVRNKLSIGTAVDPTLSVTSIHHGMYPGMMFNNQPESLGYAYRFDPMSPTLGKSADSTIAELKRRASENPGEYTKWYLLGKTQSVLSWKMIAAADPILVYHVNNSPYFARPMFYLSSYYMEKLHSPLMVLAVAGLLLVWLPARLQRLSQQGLFFARAMSILVLYFLVMHSIGAPYPRYSVPIRPILYGMSLITLSLVAHVVWNRFAPAQPKD
jgi:hypothetical protein